MTFFRIHWSQQTTSFCWRCWKVYRTLCKSKSCKFDSQTCCWIVALWKWRTAGGIVSKNCLAFWGKVQKTEGMCLWFFQTISFVSLTVIIYQKMYIININFFWKIRTLNYIITIKYFTKNLTSRTTNRTDLACI